MVLMTKMYLIKKMMMMLVQEKIEELIIKKMLKKLELTRKKRIKRKNV